MLQNFIETLHNNYKLLIETAISWTFFLTSIFIPKILTVPVVIYLSIGDYLKDIQAIAAILAIVVSLLTIIKISLDLKNKK